MYKRQDQRGVPARVLADRAARALGEVEADLAQGDALLDVADRLREGERVLAGGAQDVEREALRRAVADPGQAAELGDEALDGRGEQRALLLAPAGSPVGLPAGHAATLEPFKYIRRQVRAGSINCGC